MHAPHLGKIRLPQTSDIFKQQKTLPVIYFRLAAFNDKAPSKKRKEKKKGTEVILLKYVLV